MTTAPEPLTLLERALDQTGAALAAIDDGDLDSPTPCQSWDVRTLTNHVVHDLANFTISATGGRPDYGAPIPDVAGDRVEAFITGAVELLEAWRGSGDMNRVVELHLGILPVSFLVNQQVAELAVHAWDIATATGQKVDWDDQVAEAALAWAATALKVEFRGDEAGGKAFGPEVELAQGATAQDRLVAFFGRDPS